MAAPNNFLLVSIYGTQTKIEKEGPIQLIQMEKSRMQKEPQWKKYNFQVRTKDGYAAVKILTKKGQVK